MAGSPSSPPPDPAAALYQGRSGQQYHEGKRGVPALALPWIHRLRAEKFGAWVRPDDRVLELGVGAGWNLAALRCQHRLGCDAADNTAMREQLRAAGIDFVASLEDVPSTSIDVALCHHVLEHLLEPATAMRDLARIVKPGGLLILHVPWEHERRYRHFDPAEPNHHLHGWNVQSLGNLATVLGWHIQHIRMRRYGWDRFAARIAVRVHATERGFRLIRAVLIALNPLLEVELVARRPA